MVMLARELAEELLKNPDMPVFAQWGPSTNHCSQVEHVCVNTFDTESSDFYAEGHNEPVPPKGHRTVKVVVIHPGYLATLKITDDLTAKK